MDFREEEFINFTHDATTRNGDLLIPPEEALARSSPTLDTLCGLPHLCGADMSDLVNPVNPVNPDNGDQSAAVSETLSLLNSLNQDVSGLGGMADVNSVIFPPLCDSMTSGFTSERNGNHDDPVVPVVRESNQAEKQPSSDFSIVTSPSETDISMITSPSETYVGMVTSQSEEEVGKITSPSDTDFAASTGSPGLNIDTDRNHRDDEQYEVPVECATIPSVNHSSPDFESPRAPSIVSDKNNTPSDTSSASPVAAASSVTDKDENCHIQSVVQETSEITDTNPGDSFCRGIRNEPGMDDCDTEHKSLSPVAREIPHTEVLSDPETHALPPSDISFREQLQDASVKLIDDTTDNQLGDVDEQGKVDSQPSFAEESRSSLSTVPIDHTIKEHRPTESAGDINDPETTLPETNGEDLVEPPATNGETDHIATADCHSGKSQGKTDTDADGSAKYAILSSNFFDNFVAHQLTPDATNSSGDNAEDRDSHDDSDEARGRPPSMVPETISLSGLFEQTTDDQISAGCEPGGYDAQATLSLAGIHTESPADDDSRTMSVESPEQGTLSLSHPSLATTQFDMECDNGQDGESVTNDSNTASLPSDDVTAALDDALMEVGTGSAVPVPDTSSMEQPDGSPDPSGRIVMESFDDEGDAFQISLNVDESPGDSRENTTQSDYNTAQETFDNVNPPVTDTPAETSATTPRDASHTSHADIVTTQGHNFTADQCQFPVHIKTEPVDIEFEYDDAGVQPEVHEIQTRIKRELGESYATDANAGAEDCPPLLRTAYEQMRAGAYPPSHLLTPGPASGKPPRSSSVGSDSSAQSSLSSIDTGSAWALTDVCTRHYVCQNALHTHLVSHDRRQHPFRCDPCSVKFFCLQEQHAHNQMHPVGLPGSFFGQALGPVVGMEAGASPQSPQKTVYKCPVCDKQVSTAVGLKVHIGMKHRHYAATHAASSMNNSITLAVVKKKTMKSKLKKMRQYFSISAPLPPEVGEDEVVDQERPKSKIQCPICYKKVGTAKGLKIHITLKHTQSPKKLSRPDLSPESQAMKESLPRVSVALTRLDVEALGLTIPPASEVMDNESDPVSHKSAVCRECGLVAASVQGLRKHERGTHGFYRVSRCPGCRKRFTNIKTCRMHVKGCVGPHGVPIIEKVRCPVPDDSVRNHQTGGNKGEQLEPMASDGTFTCHVCNTTYESALSLKRHKISAHGVNYEYTCKKCPAKFYRWRDCMAHQSACGKMAIKHHTTTTKHISSSSRGEADTVTCDLCGKICSSPHILRWHKSYQHGIKKKEKCQKRFESSALLQEHLNTSHQQSSKGDTKSSTKWKGKSDETVCRKCYLVFDSEKLMRQHMLQEHDYVLRYRCQKQGCDVSYSSSAEYNRHLHAVHKAFTPEVNPDNKCQICARTFKNPRCLRFHVTMVHHKQKRRCPVCSMTFRNLGLLNQHTRTAHAQRGQHVVVRHEDEGKHESTPGAADVQLTFECSLCGMKFMNGRSLKVHRSIVHHVSHPFVCGVCRHRFESNKELKQHHADEHSKEDLPETGDVVFTCSICSKGFDTTFKLKMHKVMKHGIKLPHGCAWCLAKFETAADLAAHHQERHGASVTSTDTTTHTTEASATKVEASPPEESVQQTYPLPDRGSLACNMCSAVFAHQRGLKMHLITKHRFVTTAQCDKCLLKFFNQTDLDNHMIECHLIAPASSKPTSPPPDDDSTDEKRPLACHICGETFKLIGGLVSHQLSRHDVKFAYHCDGCGAGFRLCTEVNEHTPACPKYQALYKAGASTFRQQQGATDEKACRTCHMTFEELAQLKRHEQEVHSITWPVRCHVCWRGFGSSTGVTYHLEHKHKMTPPSRNRKDSTGKGSSTPATSPVVSASTKQPTHSPAAKMSSMGSKYQCRECTEEFSTELLLKMHNNTHKYRALGKIFKCLICEEKYDDGTSFNAHLKTHQTKSQDVVTIHESDEDTSQGTSSSRVKRKSDDAHKPHKCPHCPRAFRSREQLGYHMRKHRIEDSESSDDSDLELLAEEPAPKQVKLSRDDHVCVTCNRSFGSAAALGAHGRVHKNKKSGAPTSVSVTAAPAGGAKVNCPTCRKPFNSREKMEQHRRAAHPGERPYQCPYCDRSYFVQSVLNAHVRGEHEGET